MFFFFYPHWFLHLLLLAADQHHAERDGAGRRPAGAALALQQRARQAALRGDAQGHPPLQGALQAGGGAGSGPRQRRGRAAADPGRHGRVHPRRHLPRHGGHPRPHQDQRPPPLLVGGGGGGLTAVRWRAIGPRRAPDAVPLRPVPQAPGEPVPLEPPEEVRGGRRRRGLRRRHPPVDQRSQGEPGRGGGHDPAGQPRPRGGDPGARARIGAGQVLRPVGHRLQHHGEPAGVHAARPDHRQILPESPAAARAPRPRHGLPAQGLLPRAGAARVVAHQHHGRLPGELQQHPVVRLRRGLPARHSG